ncbi:uncharacterized protein [Eucyclogobius newberryi]|uniref:uncharacterized protein n=1 Tax=Eucyclogobius newberryi TaxID=166745 RepID=UPI003B5B7488
MSAFDQVTPFSVQAPDYTRQPKALLMPHASLSSPVIKKTPIQIPSFDERGLVCANEPNADRSFVPIRGSVCNQASSKRRSHEERASTLQRMKPKTPCPAKASVCTSAPNMSQLVPFRHLKPAETTQLRYPSTLRPPVNLCNLVPTPQPSPTSQSQGNTQLVARESHASSIPVSNTKTLQHDILDQDTLLTFTQKDLKITDRGCQKKTFVSCNPPTMCQNSALLQGKLDIKMANIAKSKALFKGSPPSVSSKTNLKRQQQNVLSDRAVSEGIRSSSVAGSLLQPALDGLSPHLSPSLHRRCIQYLQNASLRKPNKQHLKMSQSENSPQRNVSLYVEAKRKQRGLHENTFTSRTPSPKEPAPSMGCNDQRVVQATKMASQTQGKIKATCLFMGFQECLCETQNPQM